MEGNLPPKSEIEQIYCWIMNNRPKSRSRRTANRSIHKVLIGIVAIVLVAAGAWWRSFEGNRHHTKPAAQTSVRLSDRSLDTTTISAKAAVVGYPLLPFSVIPGGVHSATELQNAVGNDPVVAAHYGDFDLTKAHVSSVEQDRLVYVSYRINDHIFWTSKRLKLPKGETVITDGTHEARTRCGNRISDQPAAPVSNKEPSAEMLGRTPDIAPEGGLDSEEAKNLPAPLVLPQPFAELLPEGLPSPSNLSASSSPSLPGMGLIGGPPSASLPRTNSSNSNSTPGSTGSTGGSAGTPGSPGSPTPPVATPEPDSLLFLAAGLFALGIRKYRNQRSN